MGTKSKAVNSETKTKSFDEEWKGHKLFSVYEVDDDGKKIGEKPIVSFGKTKSIALINHVDEFKAWHKEKGFDGTEVYNG